MAEFTPTPSRCIFPSLDNNQPGTSPKKDFIHVATPEASRLAFFSATHNVPYSAIFRLMWAVALRCYVGTESISFGYASEYGGESNRTFRKHDDTEPSSQGQACERSLRIMCSRLADYDLALDIMRGPLNQAVSSSPGSYESPHFNTTFLEKRRSESSFERFEDSAPSHMSKDCDWLEVSNGSGVRFSSNCPSLAESDICRTALT